MHILSLHHYLPYPLNNGGVLRSHYVLEALLARYMDAAFARCRSRVVPQKDGGVLSRAVWEAYESLEVAPAKRTGVPGATAAR